MPSAHLRLTQLRKEIDDIDKNLLALLKRRFVICERIALYKKSHQLSIFQEEREKKLLEKISQRALKFGFSDLFIENFYQSVFLESKRLQKAIISQPQSSGRLVKSPRSKFLTKKPKKAKIKRNIFKKHGAVTRHQTN